MKKPFINKPDLEKIVATYPTPFHLYDEKGIRKTAQSLLKAFSWNKGFKEYFAIKATPNPVVLDILKQEGCGVDCASLTELQMAEACGFKGEEIMFSSNVTPAEEYIYAKKLGAIINLDDFTHIDFLEKYAGIPETICCRYNPGGKFAIHNQIMDDPSDAKYGFTKAQILEGYKRLQQKGAKRFGVHSFLASNTLTDDYYPALAEVIFNLAVEIKETTGISLSFINLSGGIGIPYRPDDRANDIAKIGAEVGKRFNEILVPAGLGNIEIFTELGRFMLGPNGCLVATVKHKKHIYKEYIGLDACAANLMRPAMYGSYHHITVVGKEDAPVVGKFDVTGSLCENNDKFAVDRELPATEIDDLVIIHDTGAHGFSMGYNYNGKLRSAEVLLKEDGSTQLIRRAETPNDYFATLDITGVKFPK